jgi:cytochrome c-type biogenesis protein
MYNKYMQYFIVFLEGILTFTSPCILPVIPLYVCYFAAGKTNGLKNALGFCLGYTLIFITLGAVSGIAGNIFNQNPVLFNIISGVIIIFFGLNFMGVIKIKRFDFNNLSNVNLQKLTFFSSIVFGFVFVMIMSACIAPFLGSALTLAAKAQTALIGILMLFCYSLGFSIPVLICTFLIDKLKNTFDFISRNMRKINIFSGIFLIITGFLILFGLYDRLLRIIGI